MIDIFVPTFAINRREFDAALAREAAYYEKIRENPQNPQNPRNPWSNPTCYPKPPRLGNPLFANGHHPQDGSHPPCS
jgi:hypothetical protein